MSSYPKWATLDRRQHLVNLFIRSRGFCVFGHKNCRIPEHHYQLFIEGLIDDWKSDDRAQRAQSWQAERKALHSLAERPYNRGQFNAIGKDIYFANQPRFYIQGIGVNPATFKPFAKVRLASSFVHLYVDLGDTRKPLSKKKRRKAIRYGKGLSGNIENQIYQLCCQAVKDYLK